ncbi:MAG: alpha/beta hydrolase fold domain-containing protein [Phycisphaerales bacterium]
MTRFFGVTVAAAMVLGTVGVPTASAQPLAPTFSNVAYGADSAAQRLDIYLPPGPVVERPTVVWIHGGGWSGGDKVPAPRASGLVALGFAFVSINYRLTGEAIHPAQINDCRGAIRWIRANAGTYGFDIDRIGVWGSSAGGHLVALLGTSGGVATFEGVDLEGAVGGNLGFSSRVQAVCDHFGPTDFFDLDPQHGSATSSESRLVGFWIQETLDNLTNPAFAGRVSVLRSVSSRTFVTADDPPFRIAHGDVDPVVPVRHSVSLAGDLTAAGVANTRVVYPGAAHWVPATEDLPARQFFVSTFNVPACPGDWNGDRRVNTADISGFLGTFGRTVVPGNPGDYDGSGAVNTQDLTILLSNFGAICPAA